MSPGIRSGVNCTRLVRTESAAARLRTSRVLATPGNALHQHVPAAEQRDQQAGHRGVLADDGLGHLGAHGSQTGACLVARQRAGRGSGLGVGHAWDTSLSSSSSRRARSARSRSWAGGAHRVGAGRRPRRRGARCARRRRRRARRVGVVGQAQALGQPGPGGGSQGLGGVAAVAGPAVEAPEVARRLDRLDLDGQRLDGQRSEPARAPDDQRHRRQSAAARAAGTSQRGSRLEGETPSPPTRSASDGTYQTRWSR